MKNWYTRATGFLAILRFARAYIGLMRNPNKTEWVFEMESAMKANQERVDGYMDTILAFPEFRALWEERYLPPFAELEALSELPPGTLGFEYAKHMKTRGFRQDFFPPHEVETPIDYFSFRMKQTHDIWHVITGYDTTVIDELALQAFVLAQISSGLSLVILSGGMLHLLGQGPAQVKKGMPRIFEAFRRGERARLLLGARWEDQWETPLETLRAQYGLSATPVARTTTQGEFAPLQASLG